MSAAVLKSGWVTKESDWRKSWNKRFLLLTSESLSWYKNEVAEPGTSAMGSVSLLEGSVCVARTCLPEEEKPEGTMKITQRGVRNLYFGVDQADSASWYDAIALANPPHTSKLFSMSDELGEDDDVPAEVRTVYKLLSSFARFDYASMHECYHANATFEDPVFALTGQTEVSAMFKMFCVSGSLERVTFRDVGGDGNGVAWGHWEAHYVFFANGRRVHNKMDSLMSQFCDGTILTHVDDFDFYAWAKQALGPAGSLVGWTGAVQNSVRTKGRARLDEFMAADTTDAPAGELAGSIVEDLTAGSGGGAGGSSMHYTNTFKQRYDVSADKVWALVGSFDDPTWTGSSVERVEANGAREAGSTRTVYLASGNVYVDKLVSVDDVARTYSWTVVEGPMPIVDHLGTISVYAAGKDACYFEWTHQYSLEEGAHVASGPFLREALSALSSGSALALGACLAKASN